MRSSEALVPEKCQRRCDGGPHGLRAVGGV